MLCCSPCCGLACEALCPLRPVLARGGTARARPSPHSPPVPPPRPRHAVPRSRTRDNWWYTSPDDCPNRSFECYFRPLSSCTEADALGPGGAEPPRLAAATEGERVVVTDCRLDNYLNSAKHRYHVPPEFERMGLMWWRAQLAAFVLRPARRVDVAVAAARASLGWPVSDDGGGGDDISPTVVGMHIRHGDKKTESAIVPAVLYTDAAAHLARAHCGAVRVARPPPPSVVVSGRLASRHIKAGPGPEKLPPMRRLSS